jgi:ATP-dependent helicase/nuclease subunit B
MDEVRHFTTAYGRPAAELLHERIRAAKRNDALSPVTVVVPTNYVGVSTRRQLASGDLGPITSRGDGIAGLALLTVYRLAELLGAPRLALAGRRPVSTPVLAAAVREVLAEAPGVFEAVVDHPSTEEALVRAHRELSGCSGTSLDRLAASSDRSRDVVRIHRRIRELLAGSWYEEADLMDAAGEAVTARAPVVEQLGTVIVHLPQDLIPAGAELLRTVATAVPVEVIAGRTGVKDADRDVDRSVVRLGADPDDIPLVHEPPVATQVISVSDADEEARSAVAEVVAALRDRTPLERVAILYPSPEPYARILHEHLDAARIPYSGRAVRPLEDRLLGRWLLDLLVIARRGYRRSEVLGVLAEGPVRGDDGRWIPTGAWERVSREAGVVRGRRDWTEKLTRFAEDLREQARIEERGPEPRDWLVERNDRRAREAEGLRGFVGELFGRLDEAGGMTSWSELAQWCHDTIRRYLGSEQRRSRWPEEERRAAEKVEAAIDRLGGLGTVEPETSVEVFHRTLELELESDLGRVGRFGHGVLVGTPSTALGVDLDLVIMLGMAEGVSPTLPREDSLLPDHERERVAHELRPRAERVHLEHRHYLAALASGQRRVLVFPRGDLRRSADRAPSRWLLDTADALRARHGPAGDGDPRSLPEASTSWYLQVPSFAGRVARTTFPASRQEYLLRALTDDHQPGRRSRISDHPLVSGDVVLRRSVDVIVARASADFTRFDGDLSSVTDAVVSPLERIVSTTQLEAWVRCPHAYLMRYLLRVDPVEYPEELLSIQAMELGNLVHTVLEQWLLEQLEAGVPGWDLPWSDRAVRRLREIAEHWCEVYEQRGLTGHPLLWEGRDQPRLLHDLAGFCARDQTRRREHRSVPVAAEAAFGMGGEGEPVAIDLGDGRTLRVRGKVDRVDETEDGAVIVTDYKTGGTTAYTDLDADHPVLDGSKLQLPIYALALRALREDPHLRVRAEYWFTSNKGQWRSIGYELSEAILERLRDVLRIIVDSIEAGQFPQRPAEPGWRPYIDCEYCDPDGLGTGDRHREWLRLRQHEDLRDYVRLVEPEALADGEPGDGDVVAEEGEA